MMEQDPVPAPLRSSAAIAGFAARAGLEVGAREIEALARTVERVILAVRAARAEVARDRDGASPTYQI